MTSLSHDFVSGDNTLKNSLFVNFRRPGLKNGEAQIGAAVTKH